MVESVKKFSAQYWIDRKIILKFMDKVSELKKIEEKIAENPYSESLMISHYNLNKEIKNTRPSIVDNKTFYQIA